ncbi:MFS general substrate transporter [Camillea tinctor]|nr:MFS general substrate transporter [Camillea tinctor]
MRFFWERRSRSPELGPLLREDVADDGDNHDRQYSPSPQATLDNQIDAQTQTDSMPKIMAGMFCFANMGLFLSSIGVLLPRLSVYYGLTDAQVSLIFLFGPVGYLIAAQLNRLIHARLGRIGVAVIGPLLHVVTSVGGAVHPPFAVFLIAWAVGSFGTGLLDGSLCAWAGAHENANVVSGLLHGSFSVGAGLGPFLAGTLIESAQQEQWYYWYYLLLSTSLIELCTMVIAFRCENVKRYHEQNNNATTQEDSVNPASTFSRGVVWICATYLLVYVGTEAVISGWIVVFMTRIRHASLYESGLCSTAFWVGMACGRLVLGIVTERVGLRRAVTVYLVFAMLLNILFAVVEMTLVSAILIAFVGFFFGPLFPSSIVMLLGFLPKETHVRAVSFVASIGQVGAALLPFALGTMAQGIGIQSLPIVVSICITVMFMGWNLFPHLPVNAAPDELNHED